MFTLFFLYSYKTKRIKIRGSQIEMMQLGSVKGQETSSRSIWSYYSCSWQCVIQLSPPVAIETDVNKH